MENPVAYRVVHRDKCGITCTSLFTDLEECRKFSRGADAQFIDYLMICNRELIPAHAETPLANPRS